MPRAQSVFVILLSLTQACAAFGQISLQTYLKTGDPAPGAGAGISFGPSSFSTATFNNATINNLGQIAFVGFLNGQGVTSSNYYGIWANSSGSNTLLARRGQVD